MTAPITADRVAATIRDQLAPLNKPLAEQLKGFVRATDARIHGLEQAVDGLDREVRAMRRGTPLHVADDLVDEDTGDDDATAEALPDGGAAGRLPVDPAAVDRAPEAPAA